MASFGGKIREIITSTVISKNGLSEDVQLTLWP